MKYPYITPHLVPDPDQRCPPLYAPRQRHILLDLWDPPARRWGRPATEVENSWSLDLPPGQQAGWQGRAAAVGCGGEGRRRQVKKRLEGSHHHRLPLLLCLVVVSSSVEARGITGFTDIQAGRFGRVVGARERGGSQEGSVIGGRWIWKRARERGFFPFY